MENPIEVSHGDAVGASRVVVRYQGAVVLTAEAVAWLDVATLAEVLREYVTARVGWSPGAPAPAPASVRPTLRLFVGADPPSAPPAAAHPPTPATDGHG